MTFFTDLTDLVKNHFPHIGSFAVGQIIAVQASDNAAKAADPKLASTGIQKAEAILGALKKRFAPEYAALGELAHNAFDIIVKAAFAEAKTLVPAIFAPVIDSVEKSVEAATHPAAPASAPKASVEALMASPFTVGVPGVPTEGK
jgi:hypothetical protein